jgi:hypothetical protein
MLSTRCLINRQRNTGWRYDGRRPSGGAQVRGPLSPAAEVLWRRAVALAMLGLTSTVVGAAL